MLNRLVRVLSVVVPVLLCGVLSHAQSSPSGTFEGQGAVGSVSHSEAQFDGGKQTYTLTSSGQNIWANHDDFQFVWKKISGDVSITASPTFLTGGGNPHKKAVLMIRQSLDPDSAYADIAVHGSGLTALQFRTNNGGDTTEIQVNFDSDSRVRLVKRGDYFYAFVAHRNGDPLRPGGASIKIPMQAPFYIGIGLCSHDKDAVEKASFSNVDVKPLPPTAGEAVLYSVLETVPIASPERRVVYASPTHFEAPNWTHDGSAFLFNREGKIERLPVDGGMPSFINTSPQDHCNNDHGISPDSQSLAISDNSQPDHQSSVYIVPITGGTPRRVTQKSPSYWHGWSPDGKTLAFVGQRNGEFDIYTIPVTGGEETRLTTAKGLDDGPEYSPDGRYIYFNSERTGHMQIWRMNADGSDQVQITHDEDNDWFPHISPDGKNMVFVTYEPGVVGHPPDKDVTIRLMSVADGKIQVVARLFGGQGTMNVPSWSPDSQKFAFVSYELLAPEDINAK